MKTRTKKVNGPIRLTAADIAKLPPKVRAQLGIDTAGPKPKAETKKPRDTERLFKVSWYSPRLQKRVSPEELFAASSKHGAIDEAKAAIGFADLKRRRRLTGFPLPVNFIAKEVKRNGKQKVHTKGKKNLFGFGSRKQRIAKKKRKAAILTAKAGVLEAKERLRSARKRNKKRNARGYDPNHTLITRSLLNPTHGVCSCGKWFINTQLAKGTSEFGAQQYLDKWHSAHVAIEKRKAMRKATNNPKAKKTVASRRNSKPKTPAQELLLRLADEDMRHARARMISIPQTTKGTATLSFDGVTRRYTISAGRWHFNGAANETRVQLARMYVELLPKNNPGIWADIIGGLAGGAGYAAAAAWVAKKLEDKKKKTNGRPKFKVQRPTSKSNPQQLVTPALAKRWLATNKNRKDMVPARINAIAAKMKAGTYTAKTPLLFKNGKLVDGRHRLSAVVRSGKSVRFDVERVVTKKNPQTERAKIREQFLGRKGTGREMKLFTLPGGPKRAGSLAKLKSITLMNGKVQSFPKGAAYIGGVKSGKLARMVIGLKQPFPLPNGLEANKVHVYGEVRRFNYWARKPHLYGENSPEYEFTHKAGEEGGRRPVLVFHNGAIGFRGGDYKIQAEGVRD